MAAQVESAGPWPARGFEQSGPVADSKAELVVPVILLALAHLYARGKPAGQMDQAMSVTHGLVLAVVLNADIGFCAAQGLSLIHI